MFLDTSPKRCYTFVLLNKNEARSIRGTPASLFYRSNKQMDKKRANGRYYTRGNPFQLKPFQKWAKESNIEQQIVLEPFAGAKDIPQLINSTHLKCQDWTFYDIEPGAKGVVQRDTLENFPKGYNVCITNPPWLARNSATRRGLPFPDATHYDDLYKYALEQCLINCSWVAAIIPEAFIRSGLFLQRLCDFISLVPHTQNGTTTQDSKTRNTSYMFDDTEHPVGLALFAPNATSNVKVWRNNQSLGTFSELQRHLPPRSRNRSIVFNDPKGNLGLIAIDNTVSASIRFCPPAELGEYRVRNQCRSITKIGVPWDVDIDKLNAKLIDIRKKTQDVFLTAFKGLRRDGCYRRRLDWTLARSIIDTKNLLFN